MIKIVTVIRVKCEECENVVDEADKFCRFCGNDLKSEEIYEESKGNGIFREIAREERK